MDGIDYNTAWDQWDDMIVHSPAPRHRRRLILRMAATMEWSSALDAGCGNGALLAAIAGRFPGKDLAGADVSDKVIAADRGRYPGINFQIFDLASSALPAKFDLVLCSEVLEHVQDVPRALANLKSMCVRWLILTVPAGRIFEIDRLVGHRQHFNRDSLTTMLNQAGFIPVTMWRWGFPFHTLYKHLINMSPSAAMDSFASRRYSRRAILAGHLLTALFHLNLLDFPIYNQLIVSARTA